jgi:hypothetical protein
MCRLYWVLAVSAAARVASASAAVTVALVVSEGVERKALHNYAAGHTSSQEDTQPHHALR